MYSEGSIVPRKVSQAFQRIELISSWLMVVAMSAFKKLLDKLVLSPSRTLLEVNEIRDLLFVQQRDKHVYSSF